MSHFPHCTAWMALLIGEAKGKAFHLAFAFNFTNLPVGLKRLQMKRAFKRIDRFIVFTDMERKLYSEYFAISVEKFERILLGMARPIDLPGPRSVETPYVVSMGGEARDYPTLVETARLMKDTIFVLIVRPASLSDLELPSNIQVFTNIPWDDAWSLVYHAALAVIPLRNATTPNGHTTLVCGMHLGKAHVVTESSGLAEYVIHNQTAFTVPKGDVVAMQKAINLLLSDIDLAARLGDAAKLFAKNKCSEQTTLDFFSGFLDRFFRKDCVARLKKSDAQTV
ncbi:MAG TPA: glycosyltransferase [Aestuariivirga sp.]|nr:glycosyltransferase [Aestuariivirga sp.]